MAEFEREFLVREAGELEDLPFAAAGPADLGPRRGPCGVVSHATAGGAGDGIGGRPHHDILDDGDEPLGNLVVGQQMRAGERGVPVGGEEVENRDASEAADIAQREVVIGGVGEGGEDGFEVGRRGFKRVGEAGPAPEGLDDGAQTVVDGGGFLRREEGGAAGAVELVFGRGRWDVGQDVLDVMNGRQDGLGARGQARGRPDAQRRGGVRVAVASVHGAAAWVAVPPLGAVRRA